MDDYLEEVYGKFEYKIFAECTNIETMEPETLEYVHRSSRFEVACGTLYSYIEEAISDFEDLEHGRRFLLFHGVGHAGERKRYILKKKVLSATNDGGLTWKLLREE